jgi:hypothetical protein
MIADVYNNGSYTVDYGVILGISDNIIVVYPEIKIHPDHFPNLKKGMHDIAGRRICDGKQRKGK